MVLVCFIASYNYVKKYSPSRIDMLNPYLLISLLFFSILCGVRYAVGVDYISYYDCYVNSVKFSNNFAHMERGWSYISEYMAKSGFHFSIYFGMIAGLQYYFVTKAFNKVSKLLPWGVIVFFLMGEFLLFLNVLRQAIVVACFLYIVMAKPNIKIWKFLLISVLLFFIHKTAIIMIVFLPFIKYKGRLNIKPKLLSIVYIFCVIFGLKSNVLLGVLSNPFILGIIGGSEYASYINDPTKILGGTNVQLGLGYALICIVNILTILFFKQLTIKFPKYNDCFKWFYIWYVGLCINALTPNSIIVSRLTMFLTIFSIPVYALILRNSVGVKVNKLNERIIGLFVFCSMWIIFMFTYILKPQLTTNWHFFWDYIYI